MCWLLGATTSVRQAGAGPLVLRNTAILHWLKAGLAQDEVCRRAGYQGKLALEHLRAHLSQLSETSKEANTAWNTTSP